MNTEHIEYPSNVVDDWSLTGLPEEVRFQYLGDLPQGREMEYWHQKAVEESRAHFEQLTPEKQTVARAAIKDWIASKQDSRTA
jgi:hypothetical protein